MNSATGKTTPTDAAIPAASDGSKFCQPGPPQPAATKVADKSGRRSSQTDHGADGWVNPFSLVLTVAIALAPVYAAWDFGGVLSWSQWLLSHWILLIALASLPVI